MLLSSSSRRTWAAVAHEELAYLVISGDYGMEPLSSELAIVYIYVCMRCRLRAAPLAALLEGQAAQVERLRTAEHRLHTCRRTCRYTAM